MDEVNNAKKPRRMAVLRGIPADDDGEKVAVNGNHSQPRVVSSPTLLALLQSRACLRVLPGNVLLLNGVSRRPAPTCSTLHLC